MTYFTSKTYSYGIIQSTLTYDKRLVLAKERDKRQYIRGYHFCMIIWKPLVGKRLQCVKETANEVGKNAVVTVCANSHCKEDVIGNVQQKPP